MYKVSKIGLLNFWLYDEEEYEFYDGKLLLRGSNGSGKTVTMQSFIPLILDGNKSPKRLDTFGGNDKHIEYYILGDDKDASTGYLYMEFYDSEKDKYVTIGMGLSAKKGRPVEFFGFALKDGTRIHHGFELYKLKDGFNKSPLTKLELKTRLGINNEFVEKAKDYKKMVNNLLFGFPSVESYDEFINILLQIRSPKLSKGYSPSLLMQTLNAVLPPLSEEDLMPLSETIESLNSTKEKMEDLNNKIKDLTNFMKVYNNYNESILYGKASDYLEKKNSYDTLIKDKETTVLKIAKLKEEKEKTSLELKELKSNYEKAKVEKENIGETDITTKMERITYLEIEIDKLKEKLEQDEDVLAEYKTKISSLEEQKREYVGKITALENEIKLMIRDIEENSEAIHFEEIKNYLNLIISEEDFEIQNVLEIIKGRKKEIERLKNILEEKQKYDGMVEEQSSKLDGVTKEYNSLIQKLETLNLDVDNLKEEFIDELKEKNKKHSEFILEENDVKEIINLLNPYDLKNVGEAKAKWQSYYDIFYHQEMKNQSKLQAKLNMNLNELDIENEKLEALENSSEAVLPLNNLEENVDHYLESNNIEYLDFYKAIDFNDNLTKEFSNKLEANLMASGLLRAKIVEKHDVTKLKNTNITYLVPSSKKKFNLTKYFKVATDVEPFTSNYIKEILESISIDEADDTYLNEDAYRFDFLNGNNPEYESKYIGFLNRKRERERQIEEQKEKMKVLNTKISSLENLIETSQNKLNKLQEENKDFPTTTKLEEKTKEIDRTNLTLEVKLKEKNGLEDKITELNNKLEELFKTIDSLKGNTKIPLNLPSFRDAFALINQIEEKMHEVKNVKNNLSSTKELLSNNKNYLEDTIFTHDELFSNISTNKDMVKKYQVEKKAIEDILNTKEYQELQTKLKEIELILNTYEPKNYGLTKYSGSLENEVLREEESLENLEKDINQSELILEIYYDILEEELNLKYVVPDFILTKDNASSLVKNLSNSEGREKETVTSNFYKGFNTYHQSFLDYALTDVAIFNDKEATIKFYEEKGMDRHKLEKILKGAMRQDITAIYQSKKINLYNLMDSLKDDYEESKFLLSERDRHLFEDILLRTIGSKIKDRINGALEWVKDINRIMEEKQKNSNLSFYLSWLSKSKESLEEMDTKELVEIFKMDPDALSQDLINQLIKHFRAKISRAEETMVDNKETYFDIIFKILDYRNWFEFKLFYKRSNGDKKELTDKIFSVFSGGEKAKTMYVPLFASISAKLASASSNTPRLIALDEAFAGVDDANIEEMFGILKSFNLDYILTSQALWCDYPSISDISICELISDHASKTIGVKRHRWNGIELIDMDGE